MTIERIKKALIVGLVCGLIDAVYGLAAVGLSGRHLLGVLVIIALHQFVAVVLALTVHALVPDFGARSVEVWRQWRQTSAGARGELGQALALIVWALAGLISWGVAGVAMSLLNGRFATPLYEHILQVAAVVCVFGAGALIAWRIGFALKQMPFRGPLTRFRLLTIVGSLAVVGYATLWVWRDLLFKEIHPVLGVLLIMHLGGALIAQRSGSSSARRRVLSAAVMVLAVLWILGDWSDVAPMVRRGAPASRLMVVAIDKATDWDRDGVASHFGAQDCAPFDPRIFPGAVDLPDDGIDQDCYRGDLDSSKVMVGHQNDLPSVGNLRRPRKIIMVTVDALRPDHLGIYGYRRKPTSPMIDRWAEEAVVFENAYTSGPYTIAALPGLLSARGISQIPNYIAEKGSYRLAEELETLPELVRKLGYRTGAVTSGLDTKGNGFAQGVDNLLVVTKAKNDTADRVTKYAKHWLKKLGDRDGFLWLHYFDPHDPYQRHKDFNFGGSAVDRYDGSIAFMDQYLGPFLEEMSADPDTVVVLLSDHGEAFGEHGATNHGHNVYRENARIPLIVRWGGAKPQRHLGAVSIIDVLPTLVQLAGAEKAPGFGRSLVPQLLGEPSDLKRGVLTESYRKGQLYGLSTASQRLIYIQDEGRYERYDLEADPKELDDLHGQNAALDEALERQLYDHLAQGVLLRRGLTVQRMMVQALPPGVRLAEPQRFGDALELVGVRWFIGGKTRDKPEYVLSLYWRAIKKMERSWRIAVGIRSGRKSINRDHTPGYGYVPGRGSYPTHQWPVGQVIEDQVVVGRLDKLGLRDRSISVGVYEGKDKLLPVPGELKQNERGTRVIIRELKKVKPLIWGRFSSGKAKP